MVHNELSSLVDKHLQGDESEDWELDVLFAELSTIFPEPVGLLPEEAAAMHQDEVRKSDCWAMRRPSYARMEGESRRRHRSVRWRGW